MSDFTFMIEYLRARGVKSIHIELFPTNEVAGAGGETGTLATVAAAAVQPKTATPPAPCSFAGKHDIPVHRGEPAAPEMVVPHATPTVPSNGTPAPEPAKVEPAKVEPVKVEPVKVPPTAKAPESAKVEPAKAELAKAPEAAPASAASSTPKDVYAAFTEAVEKDAGAQGGMLKGLIAKMALDDLLRVNNDFQLRLDTDVPEEDLRSAVAECF